MEPPGIQGIWQQNLMNYDSPGAKIVEPSKTPARLKTRLAQKLRVTGNRLSREVLFRGTKFLFCFRIFLGRLLDRYLLPWYGSGVLMVEHAAGHPAMNP